MPHGDRGKRGRGERLQIWPKFQIDAALFRGIRLTQEHIRTLQARAMHAFFSSRGHSESDGTAPKGVHLIFEWRNPDNPNPLHSDWKSTDNAGESLADFFFTMHGPRGALSAINDKWEKEYARTSGVKISAKKPKPRRRPISKVVKRRVRGRLIRTNRVAKRKAEKPLRHQQKQKKTATRATRARGKGKKK